LLLLQFFWWETSYFATLDVQKDRLGFYIGYGVIGWMPFAHNSAILYLAERPTDIPAWLAVSIVALGAAAVWVNYESDEMRLRVRKAFPKRLTIWGKPADVVLAKHTLSDGTERTSVLLASGYNGISRHFHYVPELLIMLLAAVPCAFAARVPTTLVPKVLAWLYFCYEFVLLVDRAGRIDRMCADKYGRYWTAYMEKVPWKIIPFLY